MLTHTLISLAYSLRYNAHCTKYGQVKIAQYGYGLNAQAEMPGEMYTVLTTVSTPLSLKAIRAKVRAACPSYVLPAQAINTYALGHKQYNGVFALLVAVKVKGKIMYVSVHMAAPLIKRSGNATVYKKQRGGVPVWVAPVAVRVADNGLVIGVVHATAMAMAS